MLANPSLLIIKIGSSLLVDSARKPRGRWMRSLAADIAVMRARGTKVILVSSGAVALGRKHITHDNRKLSLNEKQAAAACGQPLLMAAWQKAGAAYGLNTAQLLLTQNDTEIRRSYLNARNTLLALLEAGVIPIINENDTVATAEIRYGDNDRLAARIAQMAGADALVLLSDVDGLYTANPNANPAAQHLPEITEITPEIEAMAGGAETNGVGSGGMITKVEAAKIATKSGCNTYLCNGKKLHPLQRLLDGEKHTIFQSRLTPLSARKQWISGAIQPAGTVTIDAGAVAALKQGKSLLFAGAVKLRGEFSKGDLLAIVTPDNQLLAKGLSNYDSREALLLLGKRSAELPENAPAELIHRDNLVMD
jgi:glutamate 5-kinase